jgi:adenylate kinase
MVVAASRGSDGARRSAAVPAFMLFGRPGSGKGTLAQLLVAEHGFVQCSTGQAMRAWAAGPLPEQRAFAAALARGEYGSDELAVRIVRDFLEGLPVGTPGVLLDGFPRNPAQLAAWQAAGGPLRGVLVEASEGACRRRLARRGYCPADGWTRIGVGGPCARCGAPTTRRPEDIDQMALRRRFADFDEQVGPVLKTIVERGSLIVVRNEADDIDELRRFAGNLARAAARLRGDD